MASPFILMEVFIIIFGSSINYINYNFISPLLFSLSWICLFIILSLCFKNKIGKGIYIFINLIFLILYLVNNVYFSMTKTFFDFNLLESTSEGMPYIFDAIKNCNILVYVSFIIIIIWYKYLF